MLEERIEKMVGEFRMETSLPVAIQLWNGKRYDLGEHPTVTLRVPGPAALRYFVNADLAKLAEAYVEGHLEVDGPIADAMRVAEGLARHWGPARKGRLPSLFRKAHSKERDAEAIRYHYDVSNDFYALWLDPRMVYSCAYYRDGSEDIATAQEQKLDQICRKLMLKPGDRLSLVRKVMGRKAGEGLVRLAEVEVVSVRREPLNAITPADVRAEGFGDWVDDFGEHATNRFVGMFCGHMDCDEDVQVTRIEWVYVDPAADQV